MEHCYSKVNKYNPTTDAETFYKTIMKNYVMAQARAIECFLDNINIDYMTQVNLNGEYWTGISNNG